MTYKGKEITEEEITTDVIRDIILNHYLTQRKAIREFKDFDDKDKIFDYEKAKIDYIKYFNRKRRKIFDCLEDSVIDWIHSNRWLHFSQHYNNWKRDRHLKSDASKKKQSVLKRRETMKKKHALEYAAEAAAKVEQAVLPDSPQCYDEQLKDKRWNAFRNFVFIARGLRCEHCGTMHNLQVHHPHYIPGRKAWEYTCNEVQVLCKECHQKEHGIHSDMTK